MVLWGTLQLRGGRNFKWKRFWNFPYLYFNYSRKFFSCNKRKRGNYFTCRNSASSRWLQNCLNFLTETGFQIDLPNEFVSYKSIELLVSSMITKSVIKSPAVISLRSTKTGFLYLIFLLLYVANKLSESDESGRSNESVKSSNRKSLGLPSSPIPNDQPTNYRKSLHIPLGMSGDQSDSSSDKDARKGNGEKKEVSPADFLEVFKVISSKRNAYFKDQNSSSNNWNFRRCRNKKF